MAPATARTCSTILPKWAPAVTNLRGCLPISKNHFTAVVALWCPGEKGVCLEAIVDTGGAKSRVDEAMALAAKLDIEYARADFELGGFIGPDGAHTSYIGDLKGPVKW